MKTEIVKNLPRGRLIFLGLSLLTIIVAEVGLTLYIPLWREQFYNILELKDVSAFTGSLIAFTVMMIGLGGVQGIKVWVGQKISFVIRAVQTAVMYDRWVTTSKTTPHYTQAMTEAVRNSTELYLEILTEILISAAIVVGLIVTNLHNPIIVAAALIYTAVASVVMTLFNRPMIGRDADWQKAEGEFRENLVKIAGGNDDGTHELKWKGIVRTYATYVTVLMNFTLFTRIKGALSSLLPYILLSSAFFSGAITLGVFMAGVATFELIVINATIVMVLYPKLTKARASRQLSNEFYKELGE